MDAVDCKLYPDNKPGLLLVDDDENFCRVMQRAFSQRGYDARLAHSVGRAMEILESWAPQFSVLDLRLPGSAGLTLIRRIKSVRPESCVVMLTGYASIATAVEAIKLGATDYLVKPVDVEVVEAAFGRTQGDASVSPPETLYSVHRLEWEHIQRVLTDKGGNISATARALHMHRRTLQRKLGKHPMRI